MNAPHFHNRWSLLGSGMPPMFTTWLKRSITVGLSLGKHRRTRLGMPTADTHDTVLDAGLRAGMVLPYSCKAGNCSTCRARVLEGEVKMLKNFSLTPDECAAGFVLTCQCVPVSQQITVSFDQR